MHRGPGKQPNYLKDCPCEVLLEAPLKVIEASS